MSDLIDRMRALEDDYEPDGWPAVQMRDISALCDQIEAMWNEHGKGRYCTACGGWVPDGWIHGCG